MAHRVRRVLPVFIAASLLLATMLVTAGPAAAGNKPGNSPNAKLCYKGGWQTLVRQDQTTFASQDDCVSYAAAGGTLTAPAPLLTLSPDGYDFGTIYAFGSPSGGTVTFTATNVGAASTGLVAFAGANGGRFSLANDTCSGNVLAPAGSCTFDMSVTAGLVNGVYCGAGSWVNENVFITDPAHPALFSTALYAFFVQAHCG